MITPIWKKFSVELIKTDDTMEVTKSWKRKKESQI